MFFFKWGLSDYFVPKVDKTAEDSEKKGKNSKPKFEQKVQKFALYEKYFTNFPFPALSDSTVISFYAVQIFQNNHQEPFIIFY